MTWRTVVVGVVLLGLLGAGLFIGFGTNHDVAARTDAKAAAEPAPEPGTTTTEAEPVARPEAVAEPSPASTAAPDSARLPQQGSSLPDVDPHKAFGSKSAPVSMEIFSDFQCPACRQFYLNNNRQLMDNYVNTGKVYLVYRDFPLPVHSHSTVAARYARAAAQIGKFEPVEQALYQNQDKWGQSGDVDGTVASVLNAAEMSKVRALVKGSTLDPMIEKDKALGRQYGVNQTPTSYIHAKGQTFPVTGVVSFDVLKEFLNQVLAQR